MQKELKSIESNEKEPQSKWSTINQLREMNINKERKEHNKNYSKDSRNHSKESPSLSAKKSINGFCTVRNHQKEIIEDNLSRTLKDIINKIDSNYYKEKKKEDVEKINLS
jgi:hypothetical protein